MQMLAKKQEFYISVEAVQRDPHSTRFVPMVSITSNDSKTVVVNLTTTLEFGNVPDTEKYGIELGQQWLKCH